MKKFIAIMLALVFMVINCIGCSPMEGNATEKFSLEKEIQGSWLETGGHFTINIMDGEYACKGKLGDVDLTVLYSQFDGTYSIVDDKIYMREYDGQMFDIMEFAVIDGKHYLVSSDGTKHEKVE